MLTVETIRKIRLKYIQGRSIRNISKDLRLSRNTVRKVLWGDETEFTYQRSSQPYLKPGPDLEALEGLLEADRKPSKRRRRSAQVLFEELCVQGPYEGGYDSVRRYVGRWRAGPAGPRPALVPLGGRLAGQPDRRALAHDLLVGRDP